MSTTPTPQRDDPTGLAGSEDEVFADFAVRFPLAGAVVAEIGGSFPVAAMAAEGVQRWYCIDPNRPAETDPTGVRHVLSAPAEAMPLPDDSVEFVFSCNALQFVDVVATLAEVRRVLRPGGVFYAHFGPIWSAVDGHQLEYTSYEGRDLTFWDDTLLPPWAHLDYEPDQLRALLSSSVPAGLADVLVHHVFHSDTVNRSFFEDYVDAMLGCGLDWVELSASDVLDYAITTPDYDPALRRDRDTHERSADWTSRRGRPTRLGPRDLRMVLRHRSGD